jgi:hypothetical protein
MLPGTGFGVPPVVDPTPLMFSDRLPFRAEIFPISLILSVAFPEDPPPMVPCYPNGPFTGPVPAALYMLTLPGLLPHEGPGPKVAPRPLCKAPPCLRPFPRWRTSVLLAHGLFVVLLVFLPLL